MISVIIPTYNAALLIERAIRSVLLQTNQDFEILIVDDGSTDNTVEVVSNIPDPRIRIFRQAVNQGPAAARNRGMREAKGEYLAYLDGDDYWEPEFLQETANFLDAHPECVAVSVRLQRICRLRKKIRHLSANLSDNSNEPLVINDFFRTWAKYQHICTGSVLLRKSVALAIGGMREDLRVCEDLELWAMLGTLGKWGFISKILFVSDGDFITQKIGFKKKHELRSRSINNIEIWGQRLKKRCSQQNWLDITPILNRITIAGVYTLLRIGKIQDAKKMMSFYIPATTEKNPLPYTIFKNYKWSWPLFGIIFRLYKCIKSLILGV